MTATSLADRSGQRAQFQVVPMAAPLGAEIRGIDLKLRPLLAPVRQLGGCHRRSSSTRRVHVSMDTK